MQRSNDFAESERPYDTLGRGEENWNRFWLNRAMLWRMEFDRSLKKNRDCEPFEAGFGGFSNIRSAIWLLRMHWASSEDQMLKCESYEDWNIC
jgi:hypothetical protein